MKLFLLTAFIAVASAAKFYAATALSEPHIPSAPVHGVPVVHKPHDFHAGFRGPQIQKFHDETFNAPAQIIPTQSFDQVRVDVNESPDTLVYKAQSGNQLFQFTSPISHVEQIGHEYYGDDEATQSNAAVQFAPVTHRPEEQLKLPVPHQLADQFHTAPVSIPTYGLPNVHTPSVVVDDVHINVEESPKRVTFNADSKNQHYQFTSPISHDNHYVHEEYKAPEQSFAVPHQNYEVPHIPTQSYETSNVFSSPLNHVKDNVHINVQENKNNILFNADSKNQHYQYASAISHENAEKYSAPLETYGPPKETYAPPTQTYGPPKETYAPPPQTYGPPKETYGPPKETYGPPKETYGPPKETYGPPKETYGPPKETYGPPAQTYGVPDIRNKAVPLNHGHPLLRPTVISNPHEQHFNAPLQIPRSQINLNGQQPIKIPVNSRISITDERNQYSNGFILDDGTRVSEQGKLISTDDGWEYVIAKNGHYEYISPEGKPIKVDWVADDKGYRATLS